MKIDVAEMFLKNHYCSDTLDANQIRSNVLHWERVLKDAERFPNADHVFISRFLDAAYSYLGGMAHTFSV